MVVDLKQLGSGRQTMSEAFYMCASTYALALFVSLEVLQLAVHCSCVGFVICIADAERRKNSVKEVMTTVVVLVGLVSAS